VLVGGRRVPVAGRAAGRQARAGDGAAQLGGLNLGARERLFNHLRDLVGGFTESGHMTNLSLDK